MSWYEDDGGWVLLDLGAYCIVCRNIHTKGDTSTIRILLRYRHSCGDGLDRIGVHVTRGHGIQGMDNRLSISVR